MSEEWRPVVGWEGLYEVSSLGRVKSLSRRVPHYQGGVSEIVGRELKPDTSGRYLRVTLSSDRKIFRESIHRLVCHSFNGPPSGEKTYALHRNGNNRNNTPGNLYWGTPKENMRDKKEHGRNHELNKTHCPQGHLYSGDNLYVVPKTGKRQCRICSKLRKDSNRVEINRRRRELRRIRRGDVSEPLE